MELYQLILIILVLLLASFVQSVTGFGLGILAMIFLPSLMLFKEANVLCSMMSIVTSGLVVLAMYRNINWKNLLFPLAGNLFANYFGVSFVKQTDSRILMLLFGIVLVLLSICFFFFSGKSKIKPTWYAGLSCGILSGILTALFSSGGPPVVIYFMQSEESTDRYLATISAYFVLSNVIAVCMKAASGFVTKNVLIAFLFGLFGMYAGSLLGKKTRDKANASVIRKAVYGFMAVSGVINIVTSVL